MPTSPVNLKRAVDLAIESCMHIADFAESLETRELDVHEIAEGIEDFQKKVVDFTDREIDYLKGRANKEVLDMICESVSISIQRVISNFEHIEHTANRLRPVVFKSIHDTLESLRLYKQALSVA